MRKALAFGLICIACLIGYSYAQETTTTTAAPATATSTTPIVTDETIIKVTDTVNKMPVLKQGFGYSVVDSRWNYATTTEVLNIKKVSLAVGYMGAAKNTGDKIIGSITYPVFSASAFTNWQFIKYLKFEPGVYAGVGNISGTNEFDWGVVATCLDVKF